MDAGALDLLAHMILLCLTCGAEIEAIEQAPDYTFAVLEAKCGRRDGEGLPPCDLLQVVRPSPPPDSKEA